MKRMKFLNGIGAMFALAVVALATTLTSCEKEDFNINVEPINAQATINATVLYVDGTTTTNVTNEAAITYSDGPVFVGNPKIEGKTVTVTAKYNNLEASNTVNVPSLEAGQILTLTTTIVLQVPAEGEETVSIESEAKTDEEKTVTSSEIELKNESDFWYYESVTYTEKTGSKIVEKNIITTDFEEISLIGGFINTLDQTYKEKQVTNEEIPVFSHSLTKVKASYTILPTVYTFYRVTSKDNEVVSKDVIATVTVDDYTKSALDIKPNLEIPGHGHAPAGHGHGFDHGHGAGNAGGGIVIPD